MRHLRAAASHRRAILSRLRALVCRLHTVASFLKERNYETPEEKDIEAI